MVAPHIGLLELAAMALASWRVAALLVHEAGPFGIVLRLRERLGITHDDSGRASSWPEDGVARLFTCVWCMSFWTTLSVYGILWVEPDVVMVLAVWGAATLLEALRER